MILKQNGKVFFQIWYKSISNTTLQCLVNQGIIDPLGMETFSKEPKLEKFLLELKLMPVLCSKKRPQVYFNVCNGEISVF